MHHQEDESVEYVSIREIFPAQIRYSILNMKDKANRRISKGDAVWNEEDGKWEYKFNHGTSILAEKDALPVVRTSFGYVLIDGHHDVLYFAALANSRRKLMTALLQKERNILYG